MRTQTKISGVPYLAALVLGAVGVLATAATSAESPRRPQYKLEAGELDFMAKSVVALLTTRDTQAFVKTFAVSSNDWGHLSTTNLTSAENERMAQYIQGSDSTARRLNASASSFLKQADDLKLKFEAGKLRARAIYPRSVGGIYLLGIENTNAILPYISQLDVFLSMAEDPEISTNNAYGVTLYGLEKFPGGWRLNDGRRAISWSGFPTNVADPQILAEMVLSKKARNFEPITSNDDPALMDFAKVLVGFVREKDTNLFSKQLLITGDDVWAMIEKSGRPGPSRKEVDEEMDLVTAEQMQAAANVLQIMNQSGVDLARAEMEVTKAKVEQAQLRGQDGQLEPLDGSSFTAEVSVKTQAKAANGTPLTGTYVLAVKEILRLNGKWKVERDIHWDKLPEGVVDDKVKETLEFENYVAKYRALPPKTMVPEIEFTTLQGDRKMKISDCKGKVVVLDFWATWCGPCQQSLPSTNDVARRFLKNDVVVLGVNVWDTPEAFKAWLPAHKNFDAIKFAIGPTGDSKDVATLLY